MENINLKFYEAYKRLDQLCKQVLSSNYGVSEYIAQMENTGWQDRQDVQSWNDDLKQLRHIRWIRTDLSHRPGSFEESLCTQDDIDWIHDFYIRLLNQTDPFSLLCQIKTKRAVRKNDAGAEKAWECHRDLLRKIAIGGAIAAGVVLTVACVSAVKNNKK